MNTALLTIKPEKVADFDGVYPKVIENSDTRTKEWIISFFNRILRTGRTPKLFEKAKIITIL
jgi:hypothetical protein